MLAAWLIAAALLMRILIPAGFMPTMTSGTMTLDICTGHGPATMTVELPGKADQNGKHGHGKADMPCAFACLAVSTLGAAGPILLAAALAFILMLGLRPLAAPRPRQTGYFRPPLRGPPAGA